MNSRDNIQEDSFSCKEINRNLGYLSEHITNLTSILIHLRASGIISEDERELIVSEKTTLSRNNCLLVLVQRKNWPDRRATFLQVLRNTGNEQCANKIEQTTTGAFDFQTSDKFDSKWWPEVKLLPKAFHQRKSENVLLTKKLKDMLSQDENDGVAVITQKVTVSGLGGIGKTTTAIWFAHEYQYEYTHILWIDCGEGILLNTFKKLAIDLKLQHRTEFDLQELSLRCFKILADLKCLLIFDNAECYIGNEGIKKVLPKSNKNFNILITSRHQDWGNANGDGKIPQYLMNVFDLNEAVEFMRKNINHLSEQQKSHIWQLCNLLGNHPLALQIAASALNRQNILNIENYIDRIKNSPEVLHDQFDSYEKTIDKTMKISLDLIQNHESNDDRNIGAIAWRIMTIFAFITPDHVPADLFIAVETREETTLGTIKRVFGTKNISAPAINKLDLDAATDLLEKYSLLTKINFVEDKYALSVHRLLQQVIRYNEKTVQEQTIKKILNCKGFLDYKLIPYSYAGKGLQEKFKEIKAKLIDKLQLNQLLQEERFTEAVELSRMIKSVLKDHVSQFNFAVCLRHNLEFKQSEAELESLLKFKVINKNETQSSLPRYFSNLGIINSSESVDQHLVRGQLFLIYLKNKNFARARTAIIQWDQLTLPLLHLNEIIACINQMSLTSVFLQRHEKENCITLRVNDGVELTNTLELHSWAIDARTLHIGDVLHLTLVNCSIILTSVSNVLMAKNITLSNTNFGKKFIEHGILSTTGFLTTEYFDFNQVEKLVLKHMRIDFNEKQISSEDEATTQRMKVFEWDKEKWMMNNFLIHYIEPLQDNQTLLTEIIINDSSVGISILPSSLKKLQLKNCVLFNNSLTDVTQKPFPNRLKQLSLVYNLWKRETEAQCTSFDISYLISPTLKALEVKDISGKCSYLRISLRCLTSIKYLDLAECAVAYVPYNHISPTELTLVNVRIIDENKENMSVITVNQFVMFKQMKHLHLNGMSIDFSEPVQLSELTLINTKVVNWEQGIWEVGKVRTFPNLGFTRMKFNQVESVKEPKNDENHSSIEMKKEKLLQVFKTISGTKRFSGLHSNDKPKEGIDTIQRIAGVLPSILTTFTKSSEMNKLQSIIEDAISNWSNCYLVHLRLSHYKLHDILKDGSDTSWIDLIEEEGHRNKLWKKELDTYASFLHRFQVAGVVPIVDFFPYIHLKLNNLRRRGGLKGSLKLFQITKDYMTLHHGLTSLIWAWSLHVEEDLTQLRDCWPGDNYVDVATVSMSDRKELTIGEYQSLLNVVGKKPIAMEEMRYVPSTKTLAVQSRWIWFTVRQHVFNFATPNADQNIKKTFRSPLVINRDNKQLIDNIFCA